MKALVLLALMVSSAFAARETLHDAVLHARQLLRNESVLTLTSIFSQSVNPQLAGQPFALTEYYSDCSKDGNPTLLLMDMGITTRNLNHGSPLSVTINSTPPKGFYSPASLPRMNLNGRMTKVTEKEGEKKALECYLSRHPDAHEWTPDNPDRPHEAHWYTFNVESVYYFGGSYIDDEG